MADPNADTVPARLQVLEREAARSRDERAIRGTLARYSHALDWLDEAGLDQVFHDDAEVDYGFFRGPWREFRPMLLEIERGFGRCWHFTAQVEVAIHGDRASTRAYNLSLAAASVAPLDGGALSLFCGFYLDDLTRRDGRWRIAKRKHVLVAATDVSEAAADGALASLNLIGESGPRHGDFRPAALEEDIGC